MKKQILLGTALFLSMFGGQIFPAQAQAQGDSSSLQAICSSTGGDTKIIQKPNSSDSDRPTMRLLLNNETKAGAVTTGCVHSPASAEVKVPNPVAESDIQESSETNPVMLEGLVDVLPTNLG